MNKARGTWRHEWVVEWTDVRVLHRQVCDSHEAAWELYKKLQPYSYYYAELQECYIFVPFQPPASKEPKFYDDSTMATGDI